MRRSSPGPLSPARIVPPHGLSWPRFAATTPGFTGIDASVRFPLSATTTPTKAPPETTPPLLARDASASATPGPYQIYAERRHQFGAERDALTLRWNRIANLRLVAFVGAALALGWGVWSGSLTPFLIGGVALATFVALAVSHFRVGRRRARAALLHDLNVNGLDRLARAWE